jgi:ATP-dependent protease Clp ATPase subunit
MNRRNFLALIGAAVPGLWLNGVGFIQLPRQMVISFSGRCSFCGKEARDVFGLAGIITRPTRICNECIDICFEIMIGDILLMAVPPPPSVQIEAAESVITIDYDLDELIPNVKAPQSKAEMKSFIDQLHRLLDQSETNRDSPKKSDELLCSFCDLGESEVKKLIAGPQSYICDLCVGDAAALLNMHC